MCICSGLELRGTINLSASPWPRKEMSKAKMLCDRLWKHFKSNYVELSKHVYKAVRPLTLMLFGTPLFDNYKPFYKELAMDPEGKNYGRGPRELTGAVDLISHYKLLPHHDFFCKRSLPLSISDTHYLHNVVGDTEIRKGEGMQLDQLIQNTSNSRDTNARIQPFDLDVLREAFQLRETSPVELPPFWLHFAPTSSVVHFSIFSKLYGSMLVFLTAVNSGGSFPGGA
ncbi:hypothetical protein JRO89_XS01G0107500 [Xanthoceras sorbifolium]|uniref:Uncharacterized protein n=1 Tax=Xanthoceras sorbifolium TaxID=99658 RepID=A0ABQ8IK55_9ROSI|nr:hypothetical protein JRO89_XS01G0107500 [Xanthoceras sorbifolium]